MVQAFKNRVSEALGFEDALGYTALGVEKLTKYGFTKATAKKGIPWALVVYQAMDGGKEICNGNYGKGVSRLGDAAITGIGTASGGAGLFIGVEKKSYEIGIKTAKDWYRLLEEALEEAVDATVQDKIGR